VIQKESYLKVADNSGAKDLQCIGIIGSTRKRYAYLGDLVRCSVKKAIPGGIVKKGEIVTAVIVRVRKEFRREDGSYVRFGDNAAIIIKDSDPVGTCVFGPIARELKVLSNEQVEKAFSKDAKGGRSTVDKKRISRYAGMPESDVRKLLNKIVSLAPEIV